MFFYLLIEKDMLENGTCESEHEVLIDIHEDLPFGTPKHGHLNPLYLMWKLIDFKLSERLEQGSEEEQLAIQRNLEIWESEAKDSIVDIIKRRNTGL